MEEVYRLLKRFGTVIYTGDRLGDMYLMRDEIAELYQLGMLDREEYQKAMLALKKEMQKLQ